MWASSSRSQHPSLSLSLSMATTTHSAQKRASAVATISLVNNTTKKFPTHYIFSLSLPDFCPRPNLHILQIRLLRPSSPAWQSQDIAPSGISIPTESLTNGAAMATDDQNWGTSSGRSPGRDRNGDGPRRSSRSRSPVGARDSERGLVPLLKSWLQNAHEAFKPSFYIN